MTTQTPHRYNTGVVVDAYSAGNFLPGAFAAAAPQLELVHVQGTLELLTTMSPPNLENFARNIVRQPDGETELMEELRTLHPGFVIPGQESAVELADRLSEALGLPTNGTALSEARRDKYEMAETLRRAGLRCARQFKTSDPQEAAAWARQEGHYPVVVKPLASAGTDGVYICSDVAEALAAARWVLASSDIFGRPNRQVLVQSYLDGTEYIVDAVSADGARHVCGVWEYDKTLLPSGKRIYDRDVLADSDTATVKELSAYTEQVLDALGIRWGAAHAEVIMTADGPALVEVGARLNGNLDPGFHDLVTGANQAGLTALAYLDPARFQQQYAGVLYRKLLTAVVYNAPTTLDGVVTEIDEEAVAEIRGLDSVRLAVVKHKPGDRIRPTTDLLSSPMRVFLAADDPAQVQSDYERVRKLKDMVYRVG
jgi:biotin carboxylase